MKEKCGEYLKQISKKKKEEKKHVNKDRERQEALEGEIAEIGRLEAIRSAREARVPKEPGEDSLRVRKLVQHPSLGTIERFFSSSEKMTAVYDLVGSLELHPSYFTLCVPPVTTILPEEDIVAYDSLVIDVRPCDEPLLLPFPPQRSLLKALVPLPLETVTILNSPSFLHHLMPLHELMTICPTRSWNWMVQGL